MIDLITISNVEILIDIWRGLDIFVSACHALHFEYHHFSKPGWISPELFFWAYCGSNWIWRTWSNLFLFLFRNYFFYMNVEHHICRGTNRKISPKPKFWSFSWNNPNLVQFLALGPKKLNSIGFKLLGTTLFRVLGPKLVQILNFWKYTDMNLVLCLCLRPPKFKNLSF